MGDLDCLNSRSSDQAKRGSRDLTVTSRCGPDEARRMLHCRTCNVRPRERKGTTVFDSRPPPGRAESVVGPVAEGCDVRQTGRPCKASRGKVGNTSFVER